MIFKNISLDDKQQDLVQILESIVRKIESQNQKKGILHIVGKWISKSSLSSEKTNIYIYGGVGRGKTMIMREFFNDLLAPKLFIHYQDFMRMIHVDVHNMKGNAMHDVLVTIAKILSQKYKYICIDELEVNDIADAMIIARLFESMMRQGVHISITSNIKPENLYKNGLQREQFLPFISIITRRFIVFPLDTNHDYRLDSIGSIENRILYPLCQYVNAKIDDAKSTLTCNSTYLPKTLEVFGRKLVLPLTYKSVLVSSFDDLCRSNLSSNDFIAIAKNFTIIIMENVPIIQEDETDVVIRFINFVDNLYFYKVLLFISLAESPDKIYPKGKRIAEFQRTISRLHEMNSHEYLLQSKGS